jgi:hypothetical protein
MKFVLKKNGSLVGGIIFENGGLNERELTQHYRKCAQATFLEWPRTSAVLESFVLRLRETRSLGGRQYSTIRIVKSENN